VLFVSSRSFSTLRWFIATRLLVQFLDIAVWLGKDLFGSEGVERPDLDGVIIGSTGAVS